MRRRRSNRRPVVVWLLPVIAALTGVVSSNAALEWSEPVNRLEGMASDAQWLTLPRVGTYGDVVVVTIDDKTAQELGESQNIMFLPRRHIARLVRAMDQARAKSVVIDLSFDAPEPEGSVFSETLATLKTTEVSFVLNTAETEGIETEGAPSGAVYEFNPPGLVPKGTYPLVSFGHGLAYVAEGSTVGFYPVLKSARDGALVPYIGLVVALQAQNIDAKSLSLRPDGTLRCSNMQWELGGNEDVLVRWGRSPTPYPTYPLQSALKAIDSGSTSAFEGKVVLVGDVRRGKDTKPTAPFGDIPGVYFVANAANTLLLPPWESVRNVDVGIQTTAIAGLSLALAWFVLNGRRSSFVIVPFLALVVALAYPAVLSAVFRLRSETVTPVLAVIVTSLVALTFMRFVSPRLDDRPAGGLDVATILFGDIVDSTGLTRQLGAQGYQDHYAEYMRVCTRAVASCGGEVERTRGDGFIATFRSKDAIDGVTGALAAVRAIKSVTNARARYAVETGPVSGGYVTEGGRKVWTSTGNTVNLASRLLDGCETFGQELVIGPTAAKLLSEGEAVTPVGTFRPKGFDEDVTVYSLSAPPETRP